MRSGACFAVFGSLVLISAATAGDNKIRLLACGDDGGAAQAFVEGAIHGYQHGILRCANVLVPGPWFPGAARRLNEYPGIGVGIHLDLNSEWDDMKYRPMTQAPTLVDANGYLFSSVPAMLGRGSHGRKGPDMHEVEMEFRAQIETGKRLIPRVAWLWPHMGAAVATPELLSLTERLAREYNLPLLGTNPAIKIIKSPDMGTQAEGPAKVRAIIGILDGLQPGAYFFITHPSLDTPEVRALVNETTPDVARHRISDLQDILTNPKVLGAIKRRGIEVMTPDRAVEVLRTGE